ncbi:MAG: HEAT repeat domain-containing protein [Phycisphaerae bacterium]
MQTPPRNHRTLRKAWVTALLCGFVHPLMPTVHADIFHMRNGDEIEAEIIEVLGADYRLRTRIGIVDLEKKRIATIDKRRSPWQRYRAKRKKCPASAEAHYNLALWCERQRLNAENLDELERVLELDPDHALARQALGYIRDVSGRWRKPPSPLAPTNQDREARRLQREDERLVRKLITDWFVTIKAIYRGRMAGKNRGHAPFRKGRDQMLAIRDPLALPALTGVLSAGNVATRRVLIEALSQFNEDEATMNLLVMTLLDPATSIRERAALALASREDDRVVSRLRDALRSDEETLLRNAATALGILNSRDAIDDLIRVLSTETTRTVRISRPVYLGGVRSSFGGYSRIAHGRRLLRYQPTSIGVLGSGAPIGTHTTYQKRRVRVPRTEVQEALIAITGKNFGFDKAAWLEWRRHPAEQ